MHTRPLTDECINCDTAGMVNEELLAFIRTQDAQGTPRETTRSLLMAQGGWSLENIEEAFSLIPHTFSPGVPPPPPPVPPGAATSTVHGQATPDIVTLRPRRHVPITTIVLGVIVLLCVGAAAVYAFVPVYLNYSG